MGVLFRNLLQRAEDGATTPEAREECNAIYRFAGVKHIDDAARLRLNYDARRRLAARLGTLLGEKINPWDL